MKRLLAMIVLSASLAAYSGAAQAGYRYHGYHGHHGGHGGAYVAAGIIGGALLLGALLSAPRYRPYYPPAPVYYVPPPPRTCYQEDVYRYLPDGRIQWGVRTSCY